VKRKRILVIGAVCAFVGAVALIACLSGPREPEYHGKKLSEWAREYEDSFDKRVPGGPSVTTRSEATNAFLEIGTNALPWALKWIEYRRPRWKYRLAPLFERNAVMLSFAKSTLFRSEVLAEASTDGIFRTLGDKAAGAVPILEGYGNQRGRPNWDQPLRALAFLGPSGVAALGRIAEGGEAQQSGFAAMLILAFATEGDGAKVVPGLLTVRARSRLKSGDLDKRTMQATFEVYLPYYIALTNCLTHSNRNVRLEAVRTMAEISGMRTDRCRPVGVALLDSDAEVRQEATNAIHKYEGVIY
jgi:hypothetical protein